MANDEHRGEFLWNVHSYINEYIRFADTKAELVVGWTTAVMGGLVVSDFHKKFDSSAYGIACGIGFGVLALSFIFAFAAVVPRLRSTQTPGFIFWKNILAHKTKQEFLNKLKAQSDEDLRMQVSEHLYDLSAVSDRKFWWVNYSIWFAFVGSVVSGALYLWPLVKP